VACVASNQNWFKNPAGNTFMRVCGSMTVWLECLWAVQRIRCKLIPTHNGLNREVASTAAKPTQGRLCLSGSCPGHSRGTTSNMPQQGQYAITDMLRPYCVQHELTKHYAWLESQSAMLMAGSALGTLLHVLRFCCLFVIANMLLCVIANMLNTQSRVSAIGVTNH
jgi:hypothetical protein